MKSDFRSFQQAKTKLAYTHTNGEKWEMVDRCIMRPDPANNRLYVAISENTGRVGVGETLGDAYIDLIVSLAQLVCYQFTNAPDTVLGRKSDAALFQAGKRRFMTKTKKSDQIAWLEETMRRLEQAGGFRTQLSSEDTANGLIVVETEAA